MDPAGDAAIVPIALTFALPTLLLAAVALAAACRPTPPDPELPPGALHEAEINARTVAYLADAGWAETVSHIAKDAPTRFAAAISNPPTTACAQEYQRLRFHQQLEPEPAQRRFEDCTRAAINQPPPRPWRNYDADQRHAIANAAVQRLNNTVNPAVRIAVLVASEQAADILQQENAPYRTVTDAYAPCDRIAADLASNIAAAETSAEMARLWERGIVAMNECAATASTIAYPELNAPAEPASSPTALPPPATP